MLFRFVHKLIFGKISVKNCCDRLAIKKLRESITKAPPCLYPTPPIS